MGTKHFSIIGLTLIIVVLKCVSAFAVPGSMNYQGYLTDNTGTPLSGDYDIAFSIYREIEGGTSMWSETHDDVSVAGGVFNVILGQPGNLLDPEEFDSPLFLGIAVGSDPEMTPRQQITSAAFAFRAAKADSVTENGLTTVMISDNAVTGRKIASEEVTSSHIASGAVGSNEIEDGAVSSGDVSFNYAASGTKGGPATDLVCTGCVSEGELDFSPGDITAVLTGHGLTGGVYSGDATLSVEPPITLSQGNWKYATISGTHTNDNVGVRGAYSNKNFGFLGSISYGVRGEHNNGNYGYLGSTGYGARGYHSASGNYGYLGSSSRGVSGFSSSGTAGYFDSPSGYGVIVNRGKVGIGTTTPDAKLEVSGGILISDNSMSKLRVGRYSATYPYAYINAESTAEHMRFQIGNVTKMTIAESGSVGIGTTTPNHKLDVLGTIRAEEVIVETGWADYVFKDDYVRLDLDQVEKHIERKGHLPGIPTEAEVKENGIGVGKLQVKLLEKIEELTLYLIDQKKEIEYLKKEIAQLKVNAVGRKVHNEEGVEN